MFTGIVEAMGRIERIEVHGDDRRLHLVCEGSYLQSVQAGESIAVSGVCLTALGKSHGTFSADVSVETLQVTTAGDWKVGSSVNLERALTPSKSLGGHFVSGHVDGVGRLLEQWPEARSRRLLFELPASLARFVAAKGSITVDGVSLTVNEVDDTRFGVNIVPHTWEFTSLGTLAPGARVNLEVDLLARYLERLLTAREQGTQGGTA